MNDLKTGMLTTMDDGELKARPMQLVQDDYDGTLWFFTKDNSPKTDEVDDHHKVNVSFSDPSNDTYVSLRGTAKINRDQAKIDELWNPIVGSWFPEGPKSPNCVLLEVKIEHGEHWKSDGGKIKFLYEITKANLTNSMPDVGENQKF